MSCWVLGLLVLLTASRLIPGVSDGQGVVAFGLGVGGGAGVGVAVTGPGFGRGSLVVAWCGRSPLLAEGLVGGAGGVCSPAVLASLVTPMLAVPWVLLGAGVVVVMVGVW